MALQLTIIRFPPGTSLAEDRKTFGSEGGLIGRGVDNDWVLSDPERFLSSKHCQVSKEGNRYFLTDLSTNGTFFNGSSEPLGRGARVALNDGDSFDVGEYRFKVALQQDADPFASSSFSSASSFDPDPFVTGGFGYEDRDHIGSESVFMSGGYDGSIRDIAPDSFKNSDPLVALDNVGKSVSGNKAGLNAIPDPFIGTGSREDSADLMSESVAWPEAKQGVGLLPEDWADDISLIGGRKSKQTGFTLPDDDSLIKHDSLPKEQASGARQQASRDSLLRSQPRPRAQAGKTTAAQVPQPQPPKPVRQPAQMQSPPERTSAPGAIDRTLLDAMGITDANLSDDQVREIHHTVGLMMRETLDGLMQVLRSRTSIKNEFRINITTIQPVENNPLKFSVSVDEVLDTMFLRRTRAYKAPLDAIQESFHSIADHQLAVIAGIRSAFRSAMSKFDPERLEEEFKQSGKGGLLPGVMKGKLWNSYQDHYQKMINDMERSFQELFGDEFVQAYEDQMRKLANARKRDV